MLFGRVVEKSQNNDEIVDKEILDLELEENESMSGSPKETSQPITSGVKEINNAAKENLDQEAMLEVEMRLHSLEVKAAAV